ncbi:DEKNAAC100892 [Brettanomyces naardenensis]|uniref:DEKNAAC100892 n=1 Tax=Brettanomyces naardenensis TaxID=13370 RepID=A0A448YF04_BRENA|nr:DEKNAAC100892 [Brettanomyces naardenensis]
MLSPSSNDDSPDFPTKTKLSSFQFPDKDDPQPDAGETLASPLSLSDGQQPSLAISCSSSCDDDGDDVGDNAKPKKDDLQHQHVSRKNSLNVDQSSLSSFGSSTNSSKLGTQNSLIFERFVQDPLIDSQPIPNSLPRHFSSENFVPPSLDTATGLITGSETDDDVTLEELEMGLPPRRPSTANLEAAFANGHSNRGSFSLSNGSHSNLTRQLRGCRPSLVQSTTAPQLTLSSFSLGSEQQQPEQQQQQQPSPPQIPQPASGSPQHPNQRPIFPPSPLLRQNKSTSSFFSYADMINQEDQESAFPIRRPSLSLSISNQRMGRTGSFASPSGCSPVAPQRSPIGGRPSRSPIFGRHNSNTRFPSPYSQGRRFTMDLMSSDSELENDPLSATADAPRRLVGLSRRGSGYARVTLPHGSGLNTTGRSPSISSNLGARTNPPSRIDNVISDTQKSSDEESLHGLVAN